MDAPQWNGSDERDLSRTPRTVEQSFWRAFRYAEHSNALPEFFAIYDGLPSFQHLVDEAKELAADALAVKK